MLINKIMRSGRVLGRIKPVTGIKTMSNGGVQINQSLPQILQEGGRSYLSVLLPSPMNREVMYLIINPGIGGNL